MIRQITGNTLGLVIELSELLEDAVGHGASVGFLAPLARAEAIHYWERTLAALGSERVLWVAESEGAITGSVQLAPCERPNGRHRADVQKLLVRKSHRGTGVASRLLATLEAYARADGRTLLVLDTIVGSEAEALYRHLQWQRAGEIPDYAATPDGRLHPTAYYFKKLAGP